MEAPPRRLPPKKDVIVSLLERSSVRLFLDPRRDGVLVPKWFLKQPELVLRIGRDLEPRIPNLEIGDVEVTCTLSFNRSPFFCRLPYAALYAVIADADGRGVVWPEDVPVESQLLKGPKPAPPARVEAAPPKPRASRLAGRQGAPPPPGAPPREAEAPEAAETGGKKGRVLPPYLRVVK